MPALIDDWVQKKLPGYAAKTRSNYAKMLSLIRQEFGPQWLIEDVRPADVARSLDKHFHDKANSSNKHKALWSLIFMRAKALTDLKRLEGAATAQALAGHTTEGMTVHYTKAREVERVSPVPIKRAS